ncbi:MAG: (2Fe-2S) ferredoxin domain-containing protein, partial [Bacilli bacterium]|nr:(2Fe-2S) ferredoxin domain-containing protein [Bacilli bacterium]
MCDCKKIHNPEELAKIQADCAARLKAKFDGSDGKHHLVVCAGTGCLATNSRGILAEIENQIKEQNLKDKLDVSIVGCFGFCSQGPFVKVYPEETIYSGVKVEDVNEIIEATLNGTVLERLLYIDPVTQKKCRT